MNDAEKAARVAGLAVISQLWIVGALLQPDAGWRAVMLFLGVAVGAFALWRALAEP